MHQGWEAPSSLVRGHFLGHWMAASARIVHATGDPELQGKLKAVVGVLGDCQRENGGEWVASIPEKYFDRMARGRHTWATQYVAEKTLSGLLETHLETGDEQALEILVNAARWFHRWSGGFSRDEFDDLLDFETGCMLRLWAGLFAVTGDPQHEELLLRYERRRLFDRLVAGEDVLTNRHANTTLPEAQGMARAYEVTGEERFRAGALAYWDWAVTRRGWFATGGQNAGEFWTPPGQLATRLGDRNQEHCTVFNSMRLAEHLLRWSGGIEFADYRERNLWNGILAQQHSETGMVTYFLPLRGGGRKTWSERTASFWCCSGTLVEAHSRHGAESWYEDEAGLVLVQPAPTDVTWSRDGVDVNLALREGPAQKPIPGQVRLDLPDQAGRPGEQNYFITVDAAQPVEFALRLRVPWWVEGAARIEVDGEPVAQPAGPSSWVSVQRRWTRSTVEVRLPRALLAEPLPDRPGTFAFLDGPVVLAGLAGAEVELRGDAAAPEDLLIRDDERAWEGWTGHWRITGQPESIRMVPLHEVTDEPYSVYFPVRA